MQGQWTFIGRLHIEVARHAQVETFNTLLSAAPKEESVTVSGNVEQKLLFGSR
jgi:hypothetical protein